jgi:hypothetical protein
LSTDNLNAIETATEYFDEVYRNSTKPGSDAIVSRLNNVLFSSIIDSATPGLDALGQDMIFSPI